MGCRGGCQGGGYDARRLRRCRAAPVAFAAGLLALLHPAIVAAGEEPDCFEQFTRGKAPVIACRFPTRFTDKERAEAERLTRGMLKDASCVVAINHERRLEDHPLNATDYVLEVPPQPVTCELTTQLRKDVQVFPITGTFAPRVVLKGGVAIDGSPRLADVKGVPRAVSWPVEWWINNGGTIRDGLIRVVNAYKPLYGPGGPRAAK
jgi:hypothetical protein